MQFKKRIPRRRSRGRLAKRYVVGHADAKAGGNGRYAVIDTLTGAVVSWHPDRHEAAQAAEKYEADRAA